MQIPITVQNCLAVLSNVYTERGMKPAEGNIGQQKGDVFIPGACGNYQYLVYELQNHQHQSVTSHEPAGSFVVYPSWRHSLYGRGKMTEAGGDGYGGDGPARTI